jgi:rod shape-determining protein MreD
MMPATLPHSVDMLIGALVGLTMDVFCNSMGIHMAACVLVMLLRPYMLGQLVNDKDRLNEEISMHSLGIETMIQYTVLLVLIHHLTVFLIASWSWSHIGFALLETTVSSMISIVLILSYNFVKYR